MGLFFPEDPHFDETKWQTGFYRYRQLLSARFGQWWRINLLTLAGFAPPGGGNILRRGIHQCPGAAAGFPPGRHDCRALPGRDVRRHPAGPAGRPAALAGGLSALLEAKLEGQPGPRRASGACIGCLRLYGYAVLVGGASSLPGDGGCVSVRPAGGIDCQYPLLAAAGAVSAEGLRPPAKCLLFCIRYFWRVLGVGVLQLGCLAVLVLFAPWTLLLLPVLGVWYILFLSQLLLYEQMDDAYRIEEHHGKGRQM